MDYLLVLSFLHTSLSFSIFFFCSSLVIFCGVSFKDVSIMFFYLNINVIKCDWISRASSKHSMHILSNALVSILFFFFLPFLTESTLRGIPNPCMKVLIWRFIFSRDITVFFKRNLLVLEKGSESELRVMTSTGCDFMTPFPFALPFFNPLPLHPCLFGFKFRLYLFTCTSSWYL